MPANDDLEPLGVAVVRLMTDLDKLTDSDVGADTLLPGWTRGHVLSHLARAADSLGRLVEWARTGIEHPQYPSMNARAAEIEAGAYRCAADLVSDVRAAGDRLDRAFQTLPEQAWSVQVRPRTGELCTAHRLVFIRLREVEIHHADLATGHTFTDIPSSVAARIIDDIVTTIAGRSGAPGLTLVAADTGASWSTGPAGPTVVGRQPDVLAWLSGRAGGENLTVTANQPLPAPPDWI